MDKKRTSVDNATLYCSFCGKSQHEVEKLIAGPRVFICDECVSLCMDIILEARAEAAYKKRLEEQGLMIVAKTLLQEKGLIAKPGSSLDKFERFIQNKSVERSLEELDDAAKDVLNV